MISTKEVALDITEGKLAEVRHQHLDFEFVFSFFF